MKKEITVDYTEGEGLEKEELKGTVTLKRLSFSEKNSLEEEATDIKIFGNTPQVKVSTSKMKELGILKSIIASDLKKTTYYMDKVTKNTLAQEKPYDLNIEGIRNLPQDVGNELFIAFTELNQVDEKKNTNSN